MATLDILIPHYNDTDGLALTLDSVATQTWDGSIRVVIADDGSKPEFADAARAIGERFAHPVTFLVNDRNRGRPYTRNVLLDAIDSPFVAWLDAGDEWYPTKLASQFAALEAAEAAAPDTALWMSCHYHWKWLDQQAFRVKRQLTDQDQVRALLVGTDLRAYLWTLLGRAETFRNVGWFDERLPRLQDLDYFLRFVLKRGRLIEPGVDDALCIYHKSDLGRSAAQIRQCNAYIFDKYRVLYNRYGNKFRNTRLYHMEMHSARFAANNDDHALAREYMWKAAHARPRLFFRYLRRRAFKFRF